MLFLEGFVTNYISAAHFDFCSTRWYSAALGYYEYSLHVAACSTKSECIHLVDDSCTCTFNAIFIEYFLFDNKPKHILLAIN